MSKKGQFDNIDVLDLIPMAKCKSLEKSGEIQLLLPRFTGIFWGSILQPLLPKNRAWIKVKLDAKGVTIWDAIGNGYSVREIVQMFISTNPDDSEQASDRVWQYLLYMEQHGMIELKEKDS
ncbi:MAG: PqqD family protein [bacterium]|nr:PqqD family protein [bacterium]